MDGNDVSAEIVKAIEVHEVMAMGRAEAQRMFLAREMIPSVAGGPTHS